MPMRCYFFNNFLGQISGRPPKKAGDKGPAKERKDYYMAVYNDLKSLAPKKVYDALTSAKAASDIAHAITGRLSGNDRDGWQLGGVTHGPDVQRAIEGILKHEGFSHTHAQKLSHRILGNLPQHWGR